MAPITITYQNHSRARIEGAFDDKKLDAHLAFVKNKFWFRSQAAKSGMWDGKTHLFHRHSGTFPRGLVPEVKRWLKKQGHRYKVDTSKKGPRTPHKLVTKLGGGITLREDQQRALRASLKAGSGIIHGSVGSGKTELAAALIESYGRPCTLFFTGRKKLARQTRERFATRLGVKVRDIGLIQGGKWEEGSTGIYVAVIDSLTSKKFAAKRQELYKRCKLLIIDEAHHSGSSTYYNTLIHCRARHRFGLTATPIGRSDSADLYLRGLTGDICAVITTLELVEKGELAKPSIFFAKIERPAFVEGFEDGWDVIYKAGIVKHRTRNDTIVDVATLLQKQGRKTLILVKELPHGRRLKKRIRGSRFLHGSKSSKVIDGTLKRLERGEVQTVIATSIMDEGVDVPAIDAVINAAGGKSKITTIQRFGRGMRKKKGDNRLVYVDFHDAHNHKLRAHADLRRDVLREASFPVKTLDPSRLLKAIEKTIVKTGKRTR